LALDAIAAINDCIGNAPWLYLQQIYSRISLMSFEVSSEHNLPEA
jgi:hypothetical protein